MCQNRFKFLSFSKILVSECIAKSLLIKIIWFNRYVILYSCKEVSSVMEGFNVSVVVPTFNRVDFVLKAIKSVSNQTFPPLEIILVLP